MAEIDTSIYKTNPPPNPVQMIGGFAQMQSALAQSRLLGQETAARSGVGSAVSGAVKPDGTIDYGKLIGSVGQAGFMAPDLLNSALAAKGTALDIATKQTGELWNAYGSLYAGKSPPTYTDFMNVLTTRARSGLVSPDITAAETRALADAEANGTLDQYGLSRYESTLPNAATPTTIGVTPSGQPVTGTQAQLVTKAANTGSPSSPATPPAAAPASSSPAPTVPAAAPAAAGPAGGGVVTALPVGASDVMQASAKQFADERSSAGNYARAVGPLTQAIPLLESVGTAGGGPGADVANEVNSFLQTLHAQMPWLPTPPGMDVDPKTNKVANFDLAQKWLTQNASLIGAGLGSGSQDFLAAAISGNPNMKMSNLAAQDAAKAMLGFARMQQAKVLAFSNLHTNDGGAGQHAGEYGDWAATWSKDQDPRAYALDLMTPDARAKLIKSIKPGSAEAKKFGDSYDTAVSTGLITQDWENAGGK